MLIDTHCHLASHRFQTSETCALIDQALAAGVGHMVTLATCLSDLEANLSIAKHPAVHTCIGIHPCDVQNAPDDAVSKLAAHAEDPRVCGIGETGLDYYHPAPDGWDQESFRQRQRDFLTQHFQLAAKAKLNVVIHTRDQEGAASFEDAIAIYQEFHHSVRAVFHCFIGPWVNAARVIDLGGLVSFGGVITFKNTDLIRDCASRCSQGTFMLETDAPYLAPVPHRGKRNEPAFVQHTADMIAKLRNESLDKLAKHTYQTANSFFRFRSEKN